MIDSHALGLTKVPYSIKEAVSVLSLGRTTLYLAIERGDLRPIKVGRRTLLLASDLASFLTKLRTAA
jgi:excisionase family DNA binding protein